ncbi:hypothetical protein M378DRAFT_172790 [Amanita muscaria Koide BX008]|uniref:Uncharacterized protein n=1 Tax=Amanita muscaria (strain Koide BX008) TaxID=946122 RepID=A0A0C2W5I8_AMAMK|nr:hypothetical protein M378DRAFT_172790 [Amanita muscaria Koide BX008]
MFRPRNAAVGHSFSLPSARSLDPEAILRSMRSDTNPFTARPFSQGYKSFLEKRMKLPVFSKLREFCKFVSPPFVYSRHGDLVEKEGTALRLSILRRLLFFSTLAWWLTNYLLL